MSSRAVLQPQAPVPAVTFASRLLAGRQLALPRAGALSPCPCNVLSQVSIPRALSLPSSKVVDSSPCEAFYSLPCLNINQGSQQFRSSSPTLGSSTEILFLYSLHMYSVYCLSSPTKVFYLP